MIEAILGLLAVIGTLFGLYQRSQKNREKDKRVAAETVTEKQQKAVEALTKGLSREQESLIAARARRAKRLRDKGSRT